MHVLIDDKPVAVERATLSAAFDAARAHADERRRVVVGAWIDGEAVDDDRLESPGDEPLVGAEIRFVTANPFALVRETMLDVAENLHTARQEQGAAAQLIQLGRMDDALGHLGTALKTWDMVRRVVLHGAGLLGLPLDTLKVGIDVEGRTSEVAVGACVDRLSLSLQELKRAMVDKDWAGLADSLGHEMQHEADRWRSLLVGLADIVGARG
jgi:hypothetical protein